MIQTFFDLKQRSE